MLSLPEITLIALTSKDIQKHVDALNASQKDIQFGDVQLVYRPDIKSIDDWNRVIIYELTDYVKTDFVMLIHADGYITHPELWNPAWLQYDFIGAPWPMPTDTYSYRDGEGNIHRVGNSVSLRSKKLLDLPKKLNLPWKSYYGNTNEDGFLCVHNRRILEENGCVFAPLEIAKHFSKEHDIPENAGITTFAFHKV